MLQRSLDTASYFAGHGFKDGGIDAWSQAAGCQK